MYTIILSTVLASVTTYFAVYRKDSYLRDRGLAILCAILAAMLGGIAGVVAAIAIEDNLVPTEVVKYGPDHLVSINSGQGASGTFIWGSGSLSSQVYYNFYTAEADGSYSPQQVMASPVVRIVEDPKLKNEGFYTVTMQQPVRSSLFYDWGIGHQVPLREEFRVPRGTLVQNFSIAK